MTPRARARWIQAAFISLGLAPALGLVFAALTGGLGANPIETVTHATGEWGLRWLLLTLAVTPLRRFTGWSWLAPLRRTAGLLCFGYACLHVATWIGLDHFFDWEAMREDIVERRYVLAGLAAFSCLLPLAITSTRGMIRRLGRRWRTLHKLVYAAAVLAIVHYLWLVKGDDLTGPIVHAGVLALLLGARRSGPRGAASGASASPDRPSAGDPPDGTGVTPDGTGDPGVR